MSRFVPILIWMIILSLVTAAELKSQQRSFGEEKIVSELEARGIDEQELRERMLENGLNPDSMANASPAELNQLQNLIEELEKENQIKPKQDTLKAKTTLPVKNNPAPREDFPVDTILNNSLQEDQLFGQQYFNIAFDYSPPPLLVNEAYILGAGDILSVSIWSSNAQFDRSFIVNNNGYIRLSDASQRIFVRGMTLAEAREKIRSRFRNFYRFGAGEFSMTLQSARNINVSLFGEVKRPGAVSFSAAFNIIDAIRMAGGVTAEASVRQIRIIQPTGKSKIFDLYAYLENPESIHDIFMEDGSIIHVPVYQQSVRLEGAIRRPAKYEIKEGEELLAMIDLAGGFEDDAYASVVQVERFDMDRKSIYDIDLEVMAANKSGFKLKNGDLITVKKIDEKAKNFVVIQGEVVSPGRYQRAEGLRIAELLDKAGIKDESKTDFAFLKRQQEDGTSTYLRLNLDEILSNPSSARNLELYDLDTLTVWSKKRFVDDGTFSVEGAIRFPGTYNYDYSQKLYFSDALLLAGGLRRDASPIAFIHRSDPLKPNQKQYIRVNLETLDTSSVNHNNLILEPFDRIEILSRNLFTERTTVQISGPLNNPGEFQYGEHMSLKDLVILAGGFKLGASTKNIEVSRVLIRENKPTEIVIAKVNADKDFLSTNDESEDFILEPYDHVKVRYVPEFEFQHDIEIMGEVRYPGIYTLAGKNEKIADLIKKAGGLTQEAFVDGATLFRQEDSLGYIVLNLADALKEESSRFNYILKDGDVIEVPKMKDFVSITGATKANQLYAEKLIENPRGINVPYHQNKNAGYYIRKYTGGLGDNASKKEIYVEHPNGEIEKAKDFWFFTVYPKVRKGSVIKVGEKPQEKRENGKEKEEIDWSKVIGDTLAQAMTIFTLILLARQATN
jgi:protein involved in polysaccharide export with SLBB domain